MKKLGKGVTGVDGKGSEDGENVTLEEFARPKGLGWGERGHGAEMDAF